LQADVDEKVYKLQFLDVGLMNAVCGLNWNTISKMDDTRLMKARSRSSSSASICRICSPETRTAN
jgi:hypothetical protein